MHRMRNGTPPPSDVSLAVAEAEPNEFLAVGLPVAICCHVCGISHFRHESGWALELIGPRISCLYLLFKVLTAALKFNAN